MHALSFRGLVGRDVTYRFIGHCLAMAFVLLTLGTVRSAYASVNIYENVFEGGMTYACSETTGLVEPCFECHAYGSWGAPALVFTIDYFVDGDVETTTLTSRSPWLAMELGWELDTDPEMYDVPVIENPDSRAAWIVATSSRTKVSVSNTVYRSNVFRDENTGRYIPEAPYSFSDTYPSGGRPLYLGFGHPNGTTVGWVKLFVQAGNVWLDASCIATGVYSLQLGTTTYKEWPVDPATLLNGGIRQLDIFVDASVAASGDGLSWESPFKSIQEAVDAVRLDKTMIHVKPGVYGTVCVDNTKFTTNHLAYTFIVQSTDGPEKTIIDGGGLWVAADGSWSSSPTRACFWYGDNPVPLYDTIRGFTLHSSNYGVEHGRVENCIVSNCFYGIQAASACNCLITGNKRIGFGGNGLQNCTVVGNVVGITIAKACNSIIWGNEKDNAYDSSFLYATNCCIPVVEITNSHNIVIVGPDNMMTDPCFVDMAAGDYRLRPRSPCIDSGISDATVDSIDLSGGKRIRGTDVDIGCFEFVPTMSNTNLSQCVTVPPEWLEKYFALDRAVSSDEAYLEAVQAKTMNPRDGTAAGGMLRAWESYLWDLDPTDSNQTAYVEISMTNGIPYVNIVPASSNRVYTLLGKESLSAEGWARTKNFLDATFLVTNRFFKMSVDLK